MKQDQLASHSPNLKAHNNNEKREPMEQHTSVAHPGIKIATAWGALMVTSWADVAAALAAIYSALLICEWLWKRLIRPFCERRGWVKRKLRRATD